MLHTFCQVGGGRRGAAAVGEGVDVEAEAVAARRGVVARLDVVMQREASRSAPRSQADCSVGEKNKAAQLA